MSTALARPGISSVFTSWTVEPLALVVAAALVAWYVLAVRRHDARAPRARWSRGRSLVFALGVLLFLWTTNGFWQVYASSLFWVWTSQTLLLWLFVPFVLLWGHPLQLAQALSGPGGRVERVLRSRPVRVVSNPLVGPALVPVLSFALFFGPAAGWAIGVPALGWALHLILVLVGVAMVLPLVGLEEEASSLAVGLSLAIGSFELVIDALPGIVLRLQTKLATGWFQHMTAQPWTPRPLRDQQIAGGIVWSLAELIDLPFLLLVYRRWLRADARDAARVDAVLEAERAARRGLSQDAADDQPDRDVVAERDVPWWVTDPAMQQRLRRRG